MRFPARLPAAALAAGLAASPAPAFDIAAMTEAERQAFRAEIRAYLVENPEVLMEAIGVLEAREAEAQAGLDAELIAKAREELVDDGTSWVGGNPDGDIALVEFMDYRCGYCRKAFPEVEELVASDGNIRFVLKEFPILGDESLLAARFAIATRNVAGPDAYKQAHDALMTMRGTIHDGALWQLAERLGLDIEAVMEAMEAEEVREELLANRVLAENLQINGTPGYVLGDELLRGYVPLSAMREMVKQARAQ